MDTEPKLSERGELEPAVREATSWLSENGIAVFWGRLEGGNLPRGQWDSAIAASSAAFLTLAKVMGARLVFVDVTVCEVKKLASRVTDHSIDGVTELLSRLYDHDGQIAELTLSWIGEGIVLEFSNSASWADEYYQLLEAAEDEDAEESENDDETVPDEEEVRKHAELLARDPRFQAAKSDAQRRYAAKRTLGPLLEGQMNVLEAVLEEAKSVFDLDVKPELDRKLAEDVERLRAEGLTKGQIARRLGISANRMKSMF